MKISYANKFNELSFFASLKLIFRVFRVFRLFSVMIYSTVNRRCILPEFVFAISPEKGILPFLSTVFFNYLRKDCKRCLLSHNSQEISSTGSEAAFALIDFLQRY